MYRKVESSDRSKSCFELPFEGKLCEQNRWVILAKLIPWSEFEQEYALNFSEEMGAPAQPFRMALGALIIKVLDVGWAPPNTSRLSFYLSLRGGVRRD